MNINPRRPGLVTTFGCRSVVYRRDSGSETLVMDFEYDGNGNTTKKTEYLENAQEVTSYEYDILNRLIVSYGPQGSASYRYDNAGNRYFKTNDDGESTLYLRHGQIAVAMELEWDGSSSKVNRYILSGDLIAGRVTTENGEITRSYYHLDHLNSTKWVTDEEALVQVRYEYRAFGEQLKRLDGNGDEVGDIAGYSYSGKELDGENDLYYFNARYYDASLGRFINVDPIQAGLNWYVYCSNNPINMVDPTGLDPKDSLKAFVNSSISTLAGYMEAQGGAAMVVAPDGGSMDPVGIALIVDGGARALGGVWDASVYYSAAIGEIVSPSSFSDEMDHTVKKLDNAVPENLGGLIGKFMDLSEGNNWSEEGPWENRGDMINDVATMAVSITTLTQTLQKGAGMIPALKETFSTGASALDVGGDVQFQSEGSNTEEQE
ncbi:MAG: RHS repeat-associated core domain-containing protein [Spirochaetaceae bacterium]|jgi:RHS repeat-associated protein|nr:RHS repeat-associated core domain-containing protein [Spirochaetaceae bacterium]